MRKYLLSFIIIILITTFFNIDVKALSNDTSLIYDVEEFIVTETEITFKGWALIHGYHNYGGQNTKISIVANNSMEVETSSYNSSKNIALYKSLCIKTGDECYEKYGQASCVQGRGTSSCHYDNVGFNITFKINELINKFGKDKSISFKIKVTTRDVKTGKKIERTEDIAVSSKAVNAADGQFINNNKIQIDGGNNIIHISDISNTAKITVYPARVLSDLKGTRVKNTFIWKQNQKYTITNVSNSTKEDYEALKMYQLSYKQEYDKKYDDKYNYAPAGTGTTGWAYATWLKVDGSVKITLEDPKKDDNKCPAGSGYNAQVLQCAEEKYYCETTTTNKNLTDTITTKHPKYYEYSKYGKGNFCTEELTRTVKLNAKIIQQGTMKFDIDEKVIYSGGGFAFASSYNGNIKYEFTNVTYTIKEKEHYLKAIYKTNPETREKELIGYKDKCRDKTHSYTVTKGSEEWDIAVEYMQSLLEKPKDNARTLSFDSNKVGTSKKSIGSWTVTYSGDSDGNNKTWEEGEVIEYKLDFELDKACINKQTSAIRYISSDSECLENERDGGEKYYIPIKQPTGTFPVGVKIDDLNMLKSKTWKVNYECNVNCNQKLYDIEKNKISYKFIYRPINMNNPFPNREEGNNWSLFMNDQAAIEDKLNRDTLEYEINLGPNQITSIKSYNRNHNYTSLSTITNGGRSLYLNELNFEVRTGKYNSLGECSSDCWTNGNSAY